MSVNEILDVDLDTPRRESPWGGRLLVFLGLVAFVAVGVALVRGGADEPPDDDAAETDEDDGRIVTIEVESAGRADGVDSLRMPMRAVPDDGLIDGQVVELYAEGFAPATSVAMVQCVGIDGTPGGEGNCDVGNYTLGGSDESGTVSATMTVRRFITTTNAGAVDCADPGAFQCVVVVANIADYDESATANVWFDPEVAGRRGPAITVSATDDLDDGQIVTVTGSGFPADATVIVGECVVGGTSYGIQGCWGTDTRLADVIADGEGAFTVDVAVRRVAHGVDCFGNPYGCRIAARADAVPFQLGDGSATNPVRLWFDGTEPPEDIEFGVAYALNPDRDLTDGETVVLALGNLTTTGDCLTETFLDEDGVEFEAITSCELVPLEAGVVVVQQCVDLAAGEEYCTDAVEVAVSAGAATADVTVQRFFERASGELVDCAQTGRLCELRLGGDLNGFVPLRFATDG
ncbi:MAG: neocarzinostatin apoprotein domain-containing protein [Actinomycetota bacterium]